MIVFKTLVRVIHEFRPVNLTKLFINIVDLDYLSLLINIKDIKLLFVIN